MNIPGQRLQPWSDVAEILRDCQFCKLTVWGYFGFMLIVLHSGSRRTQGLSARPAALTQTLHACLFKGHTAGTGEASYGRLRSVPPHFFAAARVTWTAWNVVSARCKPRDGAIRWHLCCLIPFLSGAVSAGRSLLRRLLALKRALIFFISSPAVVKAVRTLLTRRRLSEPFGPGPSCYNVTMEAEILPCGRIYTHCDVTRTSSRGACWEMKCFRPVFCSHCTDAAMQNHPASWHGGFSIMWFKWKDVVVVTSHHLRGS